MDILINKIKEISKNIFKLDNIKIFNNIQIILDKDLNFINQIVLGIYNDSTDMKEIKVDNNLNLLEYYKDIDPVSNYKNISLNLNDFDFDNRFGPLISYDINDNPTEIYYRSLSHDHVIIRKDMKNNIRKYYDFMNCYNIGKSKYLIDKYNINHMFVYELSKENNDYKYSISINKNTKNLDELLKIIGDKWLSVLQQ